MHCSEIGWQLFYENGPYSLFQYSGPMNLPENFLGCQQGNSSMKIYFVMEQVKSLFKKKLLQGLLVRAPSIILMVFFCKVNIRLLLQEFLPPPPKKIIPFCIIEWKYAK